MFCLLDPTSETPCEWFRKSGCVHLVMTMCCLLFVPNEKRYLLIFDFFFGSVILTLLLFVLGCAKGNGGF
jgi:hypothetical protein